MSSYRAIFSPKVLHEVASNSTSIPVPVQWTMYEGSDAPLIIFLTSIKSIVVHQSHRWIIGKN